MVEAAAVVGVAKAEVPVVEAAAVEAEVAPLLSVVVADSVDVAEDNDICSVDLN